jgi:hypothetical protein
LNLKKSIVLFLFAVIISLPVFPQIKFGIKTGATEAFVPIYDISFGSIYINPDHKGDLGIHAGAFFRINKEVLYFQPEVTFESNTFEYTVRENYVIKVARQSINKLDIPLLIGAQFDLIRLCLGPSASIKIGSPEALVDDADFNKLYDKISWEYQVGFGIDLLEKIDLEVRYRGYLGKDYEGIEKIGYQTITLKKSIASFLFSIGYMF